MLPRSVLLPAGVLLIAGSVFPAAAAPAEVDMSVVEKWINNSSGAERIQVDFSQKRTLRTLKSPIASRGTLWLDLSTKRFRWQVGNPARTIVINDGKRLAIIQTLTKTIEYRTPGSSVSGAPPGLSAMAQGFPRSMAAFKREYRVLSIERKGAVHEIRSQPLGASARGVREFTFLVDAEHFTLRGFQVVLKDGSGVRSDFSRVVRNPSLPENLFTVDTDGYRVKS